MEARRSNVFAVIWAINMATLSTINTNPHGFIYVLSTFCRFVFEL